MNEGVAALQARLNRVRHVPPFVNSLMAIYNLHVDAWREMKRHRRLGTYLAFLDSRDVLREERARERNAAV